MDRVRRAAVLLLLIERMRERGSWSGETHVQKAAFFLQELLDVPLDVEFTLYKHGPYSFDLHDEIASMREDGMVHIEPYLHYGPKLRPDEARSRYFEKHLSRTLTKYADSISSAADIVRDRGVDDLERVATAYYLTKEDPSAESACRAMRLVNLKPHISIDAATQAVEEVDEIVKKMIPCGRT